MKLTKKQIENIQIDYGVIIINYGEESAKRLGPSRGGGEFTATATTRDIEYDGSPGKTKGMKIIDEVNAMLKTSIMDTSLETLAQVYPHLKLVTPEGEEAPYIVNATPGLIAEADYLKNITMFAKTVKGTYKKITLYNALAENPMVLSAAPKAEGLIALEIHAHWELDVEEATNTDLLFKIEDVDAITAPTEPDPEPNPD